MNNIKIFPTKAFEKQGSYAFMKAAKYGDYMTITQYLDQDRFYILEYDAVSKSGFILSEIFVFRSDKQLCIGPRKEASLKCVKYWLRMALTLMQSIW